MSRRMFFGAAAMARLALAQEPKFSTDVKVVNILASVRNKQGKVLKDLRQDEFSLEEDGRPQTIKYFSTQHDLPLTLGLLVDTSGSMRRVLEIARGASYEFLLHVMREDRDKAFIIHFDREVELAQDLTSSRAELDAALRDLKVAESGMNRQQRGGNNPNDPNQYPQGGQYPGGGSRYPGGGYPGGGYPGGGYPGGIGWPGGRRQPQGGNRYPQDPNQYPPGSDPRQRMAGTTLYDAVLLGAEDMMQKLQGRKVLIVISDGVDQGSRVSLARAIEAAQRSETLVYCIHVSDNSIGGVLTGNRRIPVPSGGGNGKETLKRLAQETGGGYLEGAVKESALRSAFSEVEEELRNQYNIGYTPDRAGRPGEFHSLRLTTKDRSNLVQCRAGYFTRDEPPRQQ